MATVGLVMILGAVGLLLHDALSGRSPPDIDVRVERVVEQGNGFLVMVRAANKGGSTAAQVEVHGALTRDGRSVEASTITFDYIPNGATRRGGLFFTHDPRTGALAVRAQGFVEP